MKKLIALTLVCTLLLSACEKLNPITRTHIPPSPLTDNDRDKKKMIEVRLKLLIDGKHGSIEKDRIIEEGTSILKYVPFQCKSDEVCTIDGAEYKFSKGFKKCNVSTGECEDFKLEIPLQCLPTDKDTNGCAVIEIRSKMTEKKERGMGGWRETRKSEKENKIMEIKTPSQNGMKCIDIDVEFKLSSINGRQAPKGKMQVCEGETVEDVLIRTGCDDGGKKGNLICTDDNGYGEEFERFSLCYAEECNSVGDDSIIECVRKGDGGGECDNIVIKAESIERRKNREKEKCIERNMEIKRVLDRIKEENGYLLNLDSCYKVLGVKDSITYKELKSYYKMRSLLLHSDKYKQCVSFYPDLDLDLDLDLDADKIYGEFNAAYEIVKKHLLPRGVTT